MNVILMKFYVGDYKELNDIKDYSLLMFCLIIVIRF